MSDVDDTDADDDDEEDDDDIDDDDDDVEKMMTQVIDHEEDNLSDKETYSKNIPAIGETKKSYIIF